MNSPARRLQRILQIRSGHAKRDLAWLLLDRNRRRSEASNARHTKSWVFLVGCNNSGTTILHDLLAQTGFFAYMDHEGQRYTRALRMAERKGRERVWSEYVEDLRMTELDDLSCSDRLAHDWLFSIHGRDKKYVLEKTTANAVRTRWLQAAFPNSYFITVVRDGFAVSEGIRRKGGKDLKRASRHWRIVNEILKNDSQTLRRNLEVHYEDLVESPIDILNDIGGFLEIPRFTSDNIDAQAKHLSNMNGKSMQSLSSIDIDTIKREAETMLRDKGYIS